MEDKEKLAKIEAYIKRLDGISVASFPKAPDAKMLKYQQGYVSGIKLVQSELLGILMEVPDAD